ncbi:restriction endonuclease subunit S [Moraxella bovoculi]|uniref:restriction endonuclease subunit S n=1 Tax=Moraxella bovoculi TaxID=386891 RepID=UPI0021500269|nr:restriction endonuclease subunit S [Moraxella bovoculi]
MHQYKKRNLKQKKTYAWERCRLGDVGETFSGLSGKTKDDFGHGNAKYITYLNVCKNHIADLSEVGLIEIDAKQEAVKYGDVLFTTSSETPEEVGMSSVWLGNIDNVYLNSFCFGYRPNIEFNPYYLGSVLRSPSIRRNIVLLAQGISRYNISKKKMMDIEIPIPTLEEQTTIGNFFRQIDELITLRQRTYL